MVQASSDSALQALALDAELAGAAMACRYASSDEYEAELIAERRRLGAYARPRWYRAGPWVICAIVGAVALITVPFTR